MRRFIGKKFPVIARNFFPIKHYSLRSNFTRLKGFTRCEATLHA